MYKFSVLPYANAAPLAYFIPRVYPRANLICRRPCDAVLELVSGKVDAAIIPVVDYFNTPGLEMVKGLGICSDGNVESVLLQCRNQLKDARTIKLDPASRTSNLLLKVLTKKHLLAGYDVMMDEDIENPDAEVVIGDRALCGQPAFESYDLAGQWKSLTGLPFVFAVWAYRSGHPDSQKLIEILHTAKQAGCHEIRHLSRLEAERLEISQQRCYHYLTDCIHYDLDADKLAGMHLFRQLSMEFTNVPNGPIKTIKMQNLKDSMNVQTQRQFI
jgi:chorismate dehydratase